MKLTLSIIAICVIVFILQSVGVVSDSFAFMPAQFSSEPYTIVTSMFMHSSIEHLLLNMLGLFTFGVLLEHEVGKKRWLIIYFVSGFIASLGYVLLSRSPFVPAVGASGAIFGLIGSVAVLKPKAVIFTPYGPLPMLAAAVLWGATEFISLFGIDNIAHSAHLFGLFGGVVFALICLRNIDWKLMLPIVIVPIAALYLATSGMPSEIPAYKPQLPACFTLIDKSENIQQKLYLYSCTNESILSTTYPYEGGFNLAEYSSALAISSERLYASDHGKDCTSNTTYVDLVNDTAIVSGKMCDYSFYGMTKVCNNVEVSIIEVYKSLPSITSIDCSSLS